MRPLAVTIKAVLFFLWCAVVVPPQMIVLLFHRSNGAYVIPFLWQKGVCKIFGLTVHVEGTPASDRQTVFACNHVSYLDIPVIGSVLKASFIAKREVAGWPVLGFLSRLQQTAFISRSRNDAQREKNALSGMLDSGKSLILFPEGTSTDGSAVAPFKSSLFSMALDTGQGGLTVQPVTLRVDSIDGRPATDRQTRDFYAWYGDMVMAPHLAAFAGGRGAVVTLVFHAPVDPKLFADRKVLADHCRNAVQSGLGPGPATIATGAAA